MSRDEREISVPVRGVPLTDRDAIQNYSTLIRGTIPAEGSGHRYHLGLSGSGQRLLLFRPGRLPEELVLTDLLAAWLDGRHLGAMPFYECPFCLRRSHNDNDIQHRFCPCCGSADGTLPRDCGHRTTIVESHATT